MPSKAERIAAKKRKLAQVKIRAAKLKAELAALDRKAAKLEPVAARYQKRRASDRKRQREPVTAMQRQIRKNVAVDNPYGLQHGMTNAVRVLHTIEMLHRTRKIDDWQKNAADRYRWAFESCPGAIRCAIDQSAGRGNGSKSPTEDQLRAAEWLSEAHRLLGVTDGVVVSRVCGEGKSIEDIARSQWERRLLGERLRTGLRVLAMAWWPERRQHRGIVSERAADARPTGMEMGTFDPAAFKGRVASYVSGEVEGIDMRGLRKYPRVSGERKEQR